MVAHADNTPPSPAPARERSRRRLPFWVEVPLIVVVALAVLVVVQGFVARLFVVPSASMESTLHGCPGCTNDRVVADRLGYRFAPPAPGEIVVFRAPPGWASSGEVGRAPDSPVGRLFSDLSARLALAEPGEQDFVKRVIAVGGQTVACCDAADRITVDGRPLDEPYVHFQPGLPPVQEPFAPTTLGAGQLWVMGDNRNNSSDSRDHGPVAVSDVIGEVRAIVLPLSRLGPVPSGR